jgi:hypothetical protein
MQFQFVALLVALALCSSITQARPAPVVLEKRAPSMHGFDFAGAAFGSLPWGEQNRVSEVLAPSTQKFCK